MKIEPSPGHIFPDQLLGVNDLVERERIAFDYTSRQDNENIIKEVKVCLPGFDRTIERREAIAIVNKLRNQDKKSIIGGMLKMFKPCVVIVYPYQVGWEQGFCLWMTCNRSTDLVRRPFGDEITTNKVPRRRSYIIATKHWI